MLSGSVIEEVFACEEESCQGSTMDSNVESASSGQGGCTWGLALRVRLALGSLSAGVSSAGHPTVGWGPWMPCLSWPVQTDVFMSG